MKKLIAFVLGLFIALPSMAGNVPNGYTELEYIQSDGNAYIDTDVKWKSGYKIQLDLTSISSSGNYAFFGASNGAAYNNGEVAVWWNKGKFDRVIPNSNSTSVASQFGTYANNTRYLVTYDKSATTGNSDSITNEGFYDTYVGTNNIFLFGTHRTAGDVGNAPFKLHSAKMWDENNSLIRNFIPAKDSRGTVGMYDTVSQTFFTNKGSGTFTAGRELNPCRNLFDMNLLLQASGWTVSNGVYSGAAGNLYGIYKADLGGFPISFASNTQYTLSGRMTKNGSERFQINYTDGTVQNVAGNGMDQDFVVTTTSGKTIQSVSFNYGSSSTIQMSNIQLESGDTATNYVPYSAACHPTSCKNLWDPSWTKSGDYVSVTNGVVSNKLEMGNATLYIIDKTGQSANVIVDLPAAGTRLTKTFSVSSDRQYYIKINGSRSDMPLMDNKTLEAGTYTLSFDVLSRDPSTAGGVQLTNFQLEAGSTATAYTPYSASCGTCTGNLATYDSATGTVVQNGTPTPTNPIYPVFYTQGKITLRRVGDVADSYDATTGKITRRVGVRVLNGTEDFWELQTQGTTWSVLKTDVGSNSTVLPSSSQNFLCSHYVVVGSGETNTNKMWIGNSYINFYTVGTYPTVTEWTDWLKAQAANGTPVTVWYPLATPTEETVGKTWCETAIKIATTKYNTNAFSSVVTALSNAVSTIKDVVANTINQATAVANLHSGKQTKPTDTCPNGKICLLVEDEAGTPHWYEIIERAPGIVPAGSGYTQVEYLQSSGTQYIDTGFKFTNPNVLIESKVDFAVSPGNSEQDIISTYSADVATGMAVGYSGVWFQYSRGDTNVTYSTNPVGTHVISAEYNFASNTKRFSLDGGDRSGGYANTIVSDKTAKLFSNGNGNGYFLVGKMYYLKIHENGSLVRDFVPARRNSDGVLGMYDTVSGNFFTNAGSGEFTAPGYLPASYTQLTYLQSDGNQYINTGVNANVPSTSILSATLDFAATITTTNKWVFGAYPSTNEGNYLIGSFTGEAVGLYQSTFYRSSNAFNTSRHIVKINHPDGSYWDDVKIGDVVYNQKNYDTTLYLFASNHKNLTISQYSLPAKVYSCQIMLDGSLIRNFVPAQNSSGVVGMYDLVNNQFYTNQGSGTFTAGAPVQ